MSGSDRPAKRSKVARGDDDYMRGNITEIELSNFMTFSHLKCKPGPRLNLVIGPNGSGKSSIVCAIALGLGGDPQLLGRATSVGAFVKRGEESGYVRISLRGNTAAEQINLRRKIDTSNKSEWWLNGTAVTKKDIIEVIQTFNIQVNNLTQFLPQDRVCEFAKLTPVDLLRETEKAVGDPQLPVQHDCLIQKSDELGRLRNAVDRIRGTLNQEKALNAELESDVERVRQRDELLAKAELMKKKVPWLKYDMEKTKYMEAKKLKGDAQKKSDEAEKMLKDLKEPIERLKKVKAASDIKFKDASNALDGIARNCSKVQEDEGFLAKKIQSKYKEMDDLKRQEESRQQRMLKAKEELYAAEAELANLPLFEPPKEELGRLRNQIVQLDTDAAELRQQKSDIEKQSVQKRMTLRHLTDRITEKENKKNQLLAALRQSGTDKIFEAYRWLQENRNQLNKEVYGPVLLEVSISDQRHADYLEGQVPNYIWKSFITQDSGDRDFLVRNMKRFDVPILNYVPCEDHRRPPQITDEMRGVGIYSRLDQVFDAPAAVKEVLISQSNLDNSFIGSKEADQRADEAPRFGIHDLWTPEKHYRWNRSRYSDYVSASVKAVAKSRLLSCSNSDELESLVSRKNILEREISDLEETFKTYQTRQRELENKAAELQKCREEIVKNTALQKKKQNEIRNRVEFKKKRLEAMEHEDGVAPIATITDEIAKLNLQRLNNAMEIQKLLSESIKLKWILSENHLSVIEINSKIKESEDSFKEHKKLAFEASQELQKCTQELGRYRTQLAEAKRLAESIATITPDLEKAFLEMPSTIEELDDAIQDKISEANSILFLNQNVLADYERRQKQIEALTKKLEEDEKQIERCMDEVNQLKGSWLPTLRNLVSEINRTFSRNFQEMAVAGEVVLDEHETDFRAYGILIRVQFRATGQLQVLSAHHQSGGERSVSTILYLVSLQDLTNCPFRVVDEINQGMDPVNERKMFQQLVRASSQLNTPQCFLLTPKLLPDLEYSEACSIINIMNGPWIEQPSKVWKSGESWTSITNMLTQQGQS